VEIKTSALAGTLESSDVLVSVGPNPEKGIKFELSSPVKKQYGRQIKKVVMDTLSFLQVTDAMVKLVDKGALDCVIKARLEAAVFRAAKANFNWEEAR
jgi:citrate lyase subunit gamma (acyl carrier protein)